jgi:DNA-binding transcriptional regulator YiaG
VVPNELRRMRKRLRLSQAGFAALVGVAPNTVARWERGERGMRPTTARLIRYVVGDARTNRAQPPRRRQKRAS